jgi:alkylglycerol monooxygenase
VDSGHWLVVVALVAAAGDWVAVARRARRAEYVLKPLTLVVLIAAAAAMQEGNPAVTCGFTLAALVLSLAGDVFLMLPGGLFLAGLASFLLAHLAYAGRSTRHRRPSSRR